MAKPQSSPVKARMDRPMLLPAWAASLALGVWLAHTGMLTLPSAVLWGGCAILIASVLIVHPRRTPWAPWLALALALTTGMLLRQREHQAYEDHLAALGPLLDRPLLLDGVIAALDPHPRGWTLTLALAEAHGEEDQETIPLQGQVDVRLAYPDRSSLLPGDAVRLRSRLRRPGPPQAPGASDPRDRLEAQGLLARAYVNDPQSLLVLRSGTFSLARMAASLRFHLRHMAQKRLPPSTGRAVLLALLIGDRSQIPEALQEAMARTGVAHILAISGLHLALVVWSFFAGLRWLLSRSTRVTLTHDPAWIAALASLPLVVLYTLLTGARASTTRAALMALVMLIAIIIHRPARASNGLAVAAISLLAFQPAMMGDLGLQLSFASVLGIMVLVARWNAQRALPPLGPWLDRPLRWLAGLAWVSVAAALVTAPLLVIQFHRLSPFSPLANLAVVPATVLALAISLMAALLALAGLPEALHLAEGACHLLAELVLALPLPSLDLVAPRPAVLWAVLLYLALAALALTRRRWISLALGGTLFLAALALTVVPRLWLTPPALAITFLSAGHGESTLVRLASGQALLVDGGGLHEDRGMDPGERVIVPMLRTLGVGRLDLMVLTHPHADHAQGLPAVLEALEVGQVWWNGDAREGVPEVVRLAQKRGVEVHVMARGDREVRLGEATIRVLHPAEPPQVDGANDRSLVLRVDSPGGCVLLTGDVEREAEELMVARGLEPCEVLKVAHHGSRTSTSPAFLRALSPQVAVVSPGLNNPYGFPSGEVVRRIEGSGARLLRTDKQGAVTITLPPGGPVGVETMGDR